MGRAPCCDKANVKKGPWSPEEDAKLKAYIEKHGTGGNWIAFPTKAGLRRCGKSCRLRWLNYLRPNIKHGEFTDDEDRIICNLFANIGSRWSIIAAQLPGRTDNDIKNYWNTKLKKKLMGLISSSQKRPHQTIPNYPSISLLDHTDQSPPSYNKCSNSNTTYYTCTTPINYSSFNGYDIDHHQQQQQQQPISLIPSSINLQSQESFVGPIQKYYHSDHLLMFGTGDHHQASCSSSDGSRDVEYEYGVCNNNNGTTHDHHHQQQQMGGFNLQSYTYNNGVDDENQKLMISNSNGYEEKPNGLMCGSCTETPLDYGLEEIKQLISTNIVSNNFNFFVDENKTEEKVMYY